MRTVTLDIEIAHQPTTITLEEAVPYFIHGQCHEHALQEDSVYIYYHPFVFLNTHITTHGHGPSPSPSAVEILKDATPAGDGQAPGPEPIPRSTGQDPKPLHPETEPESETRSLSAHCHIDKPKLWLITPELKNNTH